MVYSLARNGFFVAGILFLPLIIGDYWAFQLGLYFLYAIAALGIGVCWGQAGFISIGQAAFMGLSAYLSGFVLIHFIHSWLWVVLLLLTMIFPGILAYFIGVAIFSGRRESGPYFAIITLSFSLLAYQIATSWYEVTGGFDGLKGIPGLPGMDQFSDAYYMAAIALIICIGLVYWLINAPVGVLWRAISQNEQRVAYFGFNTAKVKAFAFGVSGMLAGIAGGVYTSQQNMVSPELCGFLLSTDLVVWAAVGGRSSLFGPIVGAVFISILA
ncbi:MAG: branched-chain amino acid ABC transporter permease, partial [Deltaproteobacteria bacterium]|nr:branched-chain amino acid ABC transporter permease [Deltaproteobacteria bacterium]